MIISVMIYYENDDEYDIDNNKNNKSITYNIIISY